jgi:hypothetical protein
MMRATNPSNTLQASADFIYDKHGSDKKNKAIVCFGTHNPVAVANANISMIKKHNLSTGRATDSVKQIDCKTHFECKIIINSHHRTMRGNRN